MGQQIIKQPDGRFAIFSSETDTIIGWNADETEIIDHFVQQASRETRQRVERLLGFVKADQPRKAYYQFALTWSEALEEDREHGGDVWREVQP